MQGGRAHLSPNSLDAEIWDIVARNYNRRYSQPPERIAERGGFGWYEAVWHLAQEVKHVESVATKALREISEADASGTTVDWAVAHLRLRRKARAALSSLEGERKP